MRCSEAEHDRNAGRLAVAILQIAGTLLSFELISTRLFSVILWNHFAFLAISIALFGLGGGGMVLYALPERFTRERAWDQIRFCALALPVVLWIAVVVLCALPIRMDFGSSMVIYLAIIFAVTALPFAVGGAAIALALTFPLAVTVSFLGNLDWGPVIGGYLGALLLGAAYLAVGQFVSAMTENQILAFILAFVVCLALYGLGTELFTSLFADRTASLLRSLGTGSRFESIARGVVDFRDVLYYVSLTAFFIGLSVSALRLKRWA